MSSVLLVGLIAVVGCGEVIALDGGLDTPDAGVAHDAATDAEPTDTGVQPDAGLPEDAGPATDAGNPTDTGVELDAGRPEDVGPMTYQVTVIVEGDGAGEVRWPDGTRCSATCSQDFAVDAQVSLLALPGASSAFGAWSDATCASNEACLVIVDQDLELHVRFDAIYTVDVAPTGDGLGRIDGLGALCAPTCSVQVTSGTSLTVSPTPAAGATFAGWAGPCSNQGDPCTLQITAPTTLTPTWDLRLPQLTEAPGGHFCALLGPRSVRCWGHGGVGQLGWGNTNNVGDDETPASLGDLPLGVDAVQIAVGGTHSCVLQKAGSVRCWGDNAYGQLGQGNTTSVGNGVGPAPANVVDVDLGGPALQVAMGAWHTCARMASGGVRCWGRGVEGQLGYGSPFNAADTPSTIPSAMGDVPLGESAVSIAAGNTHTCALLVSGATKCWGNNADGQLGYPLAVNIGDGNATWPTPASAPPLPLGGVDVAELRGGFAHTCARFVDGSVRCWGANASGQLGDGTDQPIGGASGRPLSSTSHNVGFAGAATRIAVGADHTCVVTSLGNVECWGEGSRGRLGYEATDDENTPPGPVSLPSQRTIIELGAVGWATCAVARLDTGMGTELLCWGSGASGALGTASFAEVGSTMGTMPPAPSSVF